MNKTNYIKTDMKDKVVICNFPEQSKKTGYLETDKGGHIEKSHKRAIAVACAITLIISYLWIVFYGTYHDIKSVELIKTGMWALVAIICGMGAETVLEKVKAKFRG